MVTIRPNLQFDMLAVVPPITPAEAIAITNVDRKQVVATVGLRPRRGRGPIFRYPFSLCSQRSSQHAATETALTRTRFGSERIFPVSAEVDPSHRSIMTAHFKLAQIGMVSPRMYYLDHYTATGRIYIGYIGPHLTNAMTN
jgi:hypothetical protein